VKRERHILREAGVEILLQRYLLPGAGEACAMPPRHLWRPALIIPGYGMNSSIFGFHPEGPSLVSSLVANGVDAWTVDLRGQGTRRPQNEAYGFAELAWEDLPRAIDHVLQITRHADLDLIGCSLGAAIAFTYLGRFLARAKVRNLVTLAGLVTWKEVHPLVRSAFFSPRMLSWVRLRGTRSMARAALPMLARFGRPLLSLYLNPETTSLDHRERMLKTVEDPTPALNREIAEWIQRRELVVRGLNISRTLPAMMLPYMCVAGRQDGIVQEATARAVFDEVGATDRELLLVGTQERPVAHADLFLGRGMPEQVFQPIARFLRARGRGSGDAISSS
jgi:pimeloyl-ACP methyl ester carboxylesterase